MFSVRFRKILFLFVFLAFANLYAGYPEKPITIVVHSKPGSGIDIASRFIANIAKKYADVTIVVENKTGGSGTIAMRTVLSKRADGYTILAVTKSFISTMLLSNTGLTIDNFDWLAMMVSDPEALIVNNTSDIKTLEEIIADAKVKHGEQKWLGPLVGGLDHLFAVEVWEKLGIKARWIPYEGGSDAIAALMGKQGVVYVGNPSDVLGRPTLSVAVVASLQRLKKFPDVPTFKEKGYDIGEEVLWRGFALKKGTPPRIKRYLENLFQKISRDSAWINFVENSSAIPVFKSGEDFARIVHDDQVKAKYYLKKAGILKEETLASEGKTGLVFGLLLAVFFVFALGLRQFKRELFRGDNLIAFAMILVSLFVYYLTLSFETGKISGAVGPSSIPRLWAIILSLFSIRLLYKNFKNPERAETEKRNSIKALGLIFLMAIYIFFTGFLGFYICTALFLIAGMIWMGYRNYLVIFVSIAGFLVVTYYAIQILLQVPLPMGSLFN
jgi:tripartite-type tricarboxylate transporter receptor subunit TctC